MNAPTPGQSKVIWFGATALAVAVILGVIVSAVWGLGQVLGLLAPVLWPLAVAGVLAYLLDPVVDWIEKRGVPRTRAILLVFFVAAGLLLAVLASIVPRVVVETKQLTDKVPEYTQRIQQWMTLAGSAAVSMPTLSRTRSSGTSRSLPATDAWVMRCGCSMSDSTPPSDSPRVNTRVRAHTSSAACSPPETRKETMPPKSRLCRRSIRRRSAALPTTLPGTVYSKSVVI